LARGIGFDFGTTNSALAVASDDDEVAVIEFATADRTTPSFRSVVFFGREDEGAPLEIEAGPRAIERYLELEERRRLMQSLKSFLASDLFRATQIFEQTHTLEDLIGQIVRPIRKAAEQQHGPLEPPLVVGRPVRFAKAKNQEDELRALKRLEAAMWEAGFPEVIFEYEPVAAAHHYEHTLDHDERVLIADFGGGTSDFSLLDVGPSKRGRARSEADIIGSAGVAVAGDAFDAKIVRNVVAQRLGKGSMRNVFMGGEVPLPNWIYRELERWHHLSFLKSKKTLGFLYEALDGALEPEKIEALIHVVENDQGYALYRSVQAAKTGLSRAEACDFHFDDGVVRIERPIARSEFETWIEPELDALGACVDGLMRDTGVAPEAVDRVFMTGGSAFVPAVRRLYAERFGEAKLTGGGELISVASGLALRARDLART
jgi:hypothetical chaperone protein